MNIKYTTAAVFVFLALFAVVLSYYAGGKAIAPVVPTLAADTPDDAQAPEANNSNITMPAVPDYLDFAGERVPLEDRDVLERLEREILVNTYWQSNMMLLLKNSSRYFPEIERILAEENVPDDFKYLVVAESAFRNVKSPAGASGFWQFMPATGKEYGLVVAEDIDERYNLEKATRAACQYLKKSKAKLGSWSLAAAAYNAGSRRITNARDEQLVTSYHDLYLNTETSRYLFRILAFKVIMPRYSEYGFQLNGSDFYPPRDNYRTESVSTDMNWAEFAKSRGTNYKQLRIYNPWIRRIEHKNRSGRTYTVRIPQ